MATWITGALALALVLAGLYLLAWFSVQVGRFVLGLHEASCPHCGLVNTLEPIYQGPEPELLAAAGPGDEREPPLVCSQCQKTCYYGDLRHPNPAPSDEPARPTAA